MITPTNAQQARALEILEEAKQMDAFLKSAPPRPYGASANETIAATLAGGLIASGQTGYPHTPEGAIACYHAMLEALRAD